MKKKLKYDASAKMAVGIKKMNSFVINITKEAVISNILFCIKNDIYHILLVLSTYILEAISILQQ